LFLVNMVSIMNKDKTPIVSGTDLENFRSAYSGEKQLSILKDSGGKMVVTWPVGIGKSHSIDDVIEASIEGSDYDIVLIFEPTRDLINERRLIKNPLNSEINIVNLKPRPKIKCGDVDDIWSVYEVRGMGTLGRAEICKKRCESVNCSWLKQHQEITSADVVFGTQAYLKNVPLLLHDIKRRIGDKKILVLLDEVNFAMSSFQERLSDLHLLQLVELFDDIKESFKDESWFKEWQYKLNVLRKAQTLDLCKSTWGFPRIPMQAALMIQQRGWNKWNEQFSYIGGALEVFHDSLPKSRQFDDNDSSLVYSIEPKIPADFVVYSATIDPLLIKYRLNMKDDICSPYEHFRFLDKKTRWYNISSGIGAAKNYPNNRAQILDFFSQLIMIRVDENKKILLISRKKYAESVVEELQEMLRENDRDDIRVTYSAGSDSHGDNIDCQVHVIHYGVVGINNYEDFDCAYCIQSYYIPIDLVSQGLQELFRDDLHIELDLELERLPCRRQINVKSSDHRFTSINALAQPMMDHLESGVVTQAVGRIRPYTSACEVITFQCSENPHYKYDEDFLSLDAARSFFDVKHQRSRRKEELSNRVQEHKKRGLKQKEVSSCLGVSVRTVRRYWN